MLKLLARAKEDVFWVRYVMTREASNGVLDDISNRRLADLDATLDEIHSYYSHGLKDADGRVLGPESPVMKRAACYLGFSDTLGHVFRMESDIPVGAIVYYHLPQEG